MIKDGENLDKSVTISISNGEKNTEKLSLDLAIVFINQQILGHRA